MKRPLESEYAQYYGKYINLITSEDLVSVLDHQHHEMLDIFTSLSEEKSNYSYAEGKWSIKELFGHVIDAERIFAFRALCIARGETQPLPGFEQDDFVKYARFNRRSLYSLNDEYNHLRLSNIALIKSFDDEDLNKKGVASNNPVTVRALVYILAGHEKHHLNILRERYL